MKYISTNQALKPFTKIKYKNLNSLLIIIKRQQ